MNLILAVIGVIAVVIVLAAALYVRKLVGCLVNVGMVVVGALMLLLAIFAGPLGLFDDVETIDRLRDKFGIEDPAADPAQPGQKPDQADDDQAPEPAGQPEPGPAPSAP